MAQLLAVGGFEQLIACDLQRSHVGSAYDNPVNAATGLALKEEYLGGLPGRTSADITA